MVESYANTYLSLGFKLFWCRPDKTPLGKWKQEATDDVDTLLRGHRPGAFLAGTPDVDAVVRDRDQLWAEAREPVRKYGEPRLVV